MVIGVYLQNPWIGCLSFPAPSGGRCPLEMKYTYSITLGHVLSEYIWLRGSIFKALGEVACFFLHLQEGDALWKWNMLIQIPYVRHSQNIYGYGGLSPKPLEWLLDFSCTFRREMPFGNEIYLFNYPGSCTFRIYMVMVIYLQNPRSGCLLFPTPSGGRRPLEMKYTYPSALVHLLSEFMWLWGSISKPLGVVAFFFLHLQEGDAPWKWNTLIQVPWVMYLQNIYGFGSLYPKL